MDRTRSLGTAVAVIRTGIGTALVVAPRRIARMWLGPDADSSTTALLARALGARDAALGAATLATLGVPGARGDSSVMLRLGAMADLGDAAATLVSGRHLDRRRKVLLPALAAAFGAAGWAAADRTVAVDLTELEPDLPGEIRATRTGRGADVRAARQFRT